MAHEDPRRHAPVCDRIRAHAGAQAGARTPPGAYRRRAVPRGGRRGSPIAAARRPLGLVTRAAADDRQGVFDATNGQRIVRLSGIVAQTPEAGRDDAPPVSVPVR